MRRSALLTLIPVAALVVAIAGCSGSGSDEPEVSTDLTAAQQELYDAAKGEPALTWYSGQDPARNDAVVAAFAEKYPDLAPVTSFRLASGELANRYSQEHDSGVDTAGLLAIGSAEFVNNGIENGWWENVSADDFPELADYGDDFFHDGAVTAGINVFGIGYNTTTVADPPTGWEDVLDPAYKGKIVFGDPRNVPGYVALATVLMDEYGDDYLTKLAAQDLTVVDSMVPGIQQVGAGEGDLGMPAVLTTLQPVKDKGAPLDMVIPDTTTGNPFELVIPKDGPSSNTAKLLYEFIITEEGQKVFNGTTGSSAINAEGTAALPSDYRVVSTDEIAANRDTVLSALGLQ